MSKSTHLSHFGSQLIFGPRCHRAVLLSHHEEWEICKSNASPHLRDPKPFLSSNRLFQPQSTVKDPIHLLRDIARRLPCTIPCLRNTRRRGPRSGNKVADHVQLLYFNLPTSSRANCKPSKTMQRSICRTNPLLRAADAREFKFYVKIILLIETTPTPS
jgi:hypothetical protein